MDLSSSVAPALAPPPGQSSNFIDPPSIQADIIAGVTVCVVISTLAGLLRCYAQWSLAGRLVSADVWISLGWLFQIAFAAVLLACIPYGAGRDQWNVTMADYHQIKFLLFLDFILYDLAILGPKVAILVQLQDVFSPRTRNRFFWATVFLIGTNMLFYVALSLALVFQCDPIVKGWNQEIAGTCLNQDSLLESSGPFNIISDFLIFMLPICAVYQLQLPLMARIGVASAFAVGLFGCVCSAVRLYYSHRLQGSGDVTYLLFQNQLWANAEIATALLIANVIVLPRFVRHRRCLNGTLRRRSQDAVITYRTGRLFSQQLTCVDVRETHQSCINVSIDSGAPSRGS